MHADIRGPEPAVTLVLLHGGTGTGDYHWSKLAGTLSRGYRIHLPDLPGHGRTPLPADGTYSRATLADAVAAYLERVGAPAHVAAFSMGGHACLALATERPELFASLVLIGVSVRDHPGLGGWRAKFDPDRLQREYPVWARALSRLHEPLGGPDAWREVCRRDAGGLEVDVDVQALSDLACPVMLVRGDRDPAVEPAQYAQLRELWSQADEYVVPAGGHDVQLTRHRVVGPVLLDFWERAGAKPVDA